MNDKQRRIVQSGIKLFAKKGFHATSIQEIAENSGVSKGAFYLHFKSKEDLILAIYKYYYELTKLQVKKIEQSRELNDRQKLIEKVFTHLSELLKQKDFIMMHFRENVSLNKEIDEVIHMMHRDLHESHKRTILGVYGEQVKTYAEDSAILLEGLMSAYMKILIFHEIDIELKELSSFIVDRLDEAVTGMISKQAKAQIRAPLYEEEVFNREEQGINDLLVGIRNIVNQLNLENTEKEDLLTTILVLEQEWGKEVPQKVVFQGMLANLRGISELDPYREAIANQLEISLL